MGKRLKTQRRGAGSPIYAATLRANVEAKYVNYDKVWEDSIAGEIVDFIHDASKSAVVSKIVYDNGFEEFSIAAEGTFVGQRISHGKSAPLEVGNVKTLGSCVEGCPVFNIEKSPGGGGRKDKPFVKAGKRWHQMRAKHKKYPYPRAIAMNALNRPFGGANHHPGKSKSTSRHAAPGRKVGDIASSRTGRRKKS